MQSNEGKTLMIFNDKSGSMSGMPWNAVQKSTLAFAESLWPKGKEQVFQNVHLIYFESVCRGVLCEDKEEFVNYCNCTRNGGGTSFK